MPITRQARENAALLGLRPERLELMEQRIQEYMAKDMRQAIVAKILLHGQPIYECAYGTNTKPGGVKLDTIFPMMSISKPVVAALIMCLQEDGLVDITLPVKFYLPEFDGLGKEKICLWHLLTHTSGIDQDEMYPAIDEYVKNEFGISRPSHGASEEEWIAVNNAICEKLGIDPKATEQTRANDWRYQISLKIDMPHAPRSNMSYCSYGYQLLKYIIDAVTGEPIDTFAQRRLFNSLGMIDTHWRVPEEKWPRILGRGERSMGYPWINGEDQYVDESGSGGLKSTVGDMTRFCQMILNDGILDGNRVLSKSSVGVMKTDQNQGVPCALDNKWGAWTFGWNIRAEKKDDNGVLRSPSCLCHGGWAGTKLTVDPELDFAFALFTAGYCSNDDAPVYGYLTNILCAALE